MSVPSLTMESFGLPGVPGLVATSIGSGQEYLNSGSNTVSATTSEGPATPTSIVSDFSETDFLSPSSLASQSKRFWTESSSWIVSRLAYQSQSHSSSSAHSSMDRSNASNCASGLYRDPTAVERSNLLNITKLVIKELIEWSIRHGRSLESDHPPLQHFFIVLEHAMRHGLKPKKGLLGPKKELWDVLQTVERCTNEAQDITASIRDLPTVSTHIGRARAWLRLALMQKKLADYFKILIDHRDDILKEFYEPIALMMSDEAVVLSGLLVGLNVIDCNFCLKEEDLDTQQGVIDFSLYLRSSRSSESVDDEAEPSNMDAMLDQKNYVEELNRHLNATVTNLQTRVETLTTTNALMKEDLAIAKNAILSLQDENRLLRQKLELQQILPGSNEESYRFSTTPNSNKDVHEAEFFKSEGMTIKNNQNEDSSLLGLSAGILGSSPLPANLSVTDLSKKLHEERSIREELERDIESQMSKKAEMETTMKILEKNVNEKEDTIISLRRQLEDIKMINLEMYRKLQECEKTVKFKNELMVKLEEKAAMLAETIDKLDEKASHAEAELKNSHEIVRSLGLQIAEKELKVSTLEGDLRIEREWRQSLQETLVKDKEKISELNMELQRFELVQVDLDSSQRENTELLKKQGELEHALEDMGLILKQYDLRLDDMKEASSAKTLLEATWADDKVATHCKLCFKEFSLTRRKHHCRNCGEIFCNTCSDNVMPLPSSAKPVRVCDTCYTLLLERFSSK
ncbi:unnamed protein product [Allacma fusca]|uniref:RUN and FYVE domain-containing protein 2 n=1 Tax=Allacma fusca TaxID=39272 RepID=A0A8J2PFG1_9HEXA|nr:unnamed protein product [Allacma fusca]